MKVIIEEGDVEELAPGVYKVKSTSVGIERNYWPVGAVGNDEEINISRKMCLSLDIDLNQKPTARHWFNADQHVGDGTTLEEYAKADAAITRDIYAAMAIPSSLPTVIDLQVGSRRMRIAVGDVIEEVGGSVHWTVTGFPSTRSWACTASTGHKYTSDLDLLANDLESGKKRVRLASSTRSIAPCNKSLSDCLKHGNRKNYGGHFNQATGKAVACPYTLGDSHCTGTYATGGQIVTTIVVGMQLKWSHASDIYMVSKITQANPGINSDKDTVYVSWPNNNNPDAVYSRLGLMELIQDGQVTVTMVDDQAFPGDALVSLDPDLHDCDECYGTGLYKAFGGPCSKGCIGGA